MKKRRMFPFYCLLFSFMTISCVKEKREEVTILSLEKIDDYEINISKSSIRIGKIDSFCIDAENNVYIADSGFNQIHKCDSDGNHLCSFGGEGQGPGEFMAHSRSERLRITFGNDGNIYVYDTGNNRLSIFSRELKFVKAYAMPITTRVLDSPSVSSLSDIYFVTRAENKLIHRFDSNMELKSAFLDIEEHHQFPFHQPSSIVPFSGEFDLRKAVNSKDQLVVVSNYSLNIFIFDREGKMINKLAVNNRLFLKDFEEQVKFMKKDKKKKQGILLPFYLLLDESDRILLAYFRKEIENYEIYRYTANGILQDVLRFPEKVTVPFQCDGQGNVYAKHVSNGEHGLRKYQIFPEKEG